MRSPLILLALAAAVSCSACGGSGSRERENDMSSARLADMAASDGIDRAEAVRIARDALDGKIRILEDLVPVTERVGADWVVTFPDRLPVGSVGAAYRGQVTVDRANGSVREVLIGS